MYPALTFYIADVAGSPVSVCWKSREQGLTSDPNRRDLYLSLEALYSRLRSVLLPTGYAAFVHQHSLLSRGCR